MFRSYLYNVILLRMPKVTRKQVSVFDSSAIRFIAIVFGVSGVLIGGALFFGFSDKGAIDVTGKINSTDQSGFSNRVNANSNNASVNGGLQPAALDPNAPPAPLPAPVVEIATTTTATSTATTTASTTLEENIENNNQQSQ